MRTQCAAADSRRGSTLRDAITYGQQTGLQALRVVQVLVHASNEPAARRAIELQRASKVLVRRAQRSVTPLPATAAWPRPALGHVLRSGEGAHLAH